MENDRRAVGASQKPRTHSQKNPALEGLRALAIVGVVLFHTRPSLLRGGFLGVTLFFVLTGFLITRSIMREQYRTGTFSMKRYVIKRLKRLVPAALACIGLTALLMLAVGPSLLPKVQADALPAALFVSNWSYIFRNVPYFAAAGLPSPLTHLWFLGVTMQFYLIWPLLYRLMQSKLSRKQTELGLCTLILISTVEMAILFDPAGDTSRVYYGTDTRAAELLMGALLALALPRVRRAICTIGANGTTKVSRAQIVAHEGATAGVCIIVLVLGFTVANGSSALLYRGGYLVVAIVCAVLIACLCGPQNPVSRLLSTKPLVYLGSRSFSIYLVHYPLLLAMNPATRMKDPTALEWVLQLILILAVAEIFHRLVERPSKRPIAESKLGSVLPDSLTAKIPSVQGKPLSSRMIGNALVALCALFTLALAVLPLNWQGIADARAVQLRPEIAEKAKPAKKKKTKKASKKSADKASAKQPESTIVKASKPKAESVPKNLPWKKWTYDTATGTCNANVIMIGDSVTEGAADTLRTVLPNAYIDGKVSRQLYVGQDVLAQDLATGYDASAVIWALGTNGAVRDESYVQALIDAAGKRPVYFVTIRCPYPQQDSNNQLFRTMASKNKNVGIIDWLGASDGHPEYLYDDGIHLTPSGRDAYAALIRAALCGH